MTNILSLLFGAAEALIGLRIVLQFLGASPDSQFVEWVYNFSTPLVQPFAGMFGQSATIVGDGAMTTSVFDWTAFIALIVYGIVGGLVFSRAHHK